MKIIFKFLISVLLFFISVSLTTFFVIYQAKKGQLDRPIEYVLEYYLKLNNFDVKFNNLNLKGNQIKIDAVKITKNKATINLQNILINEDFVFNYMQSKFLVGVIVDKLMIKENKGEKDIESNNADDLVHGKLNLNYQYYVTSDSSNCNIFLDNVSYQQGNEKLTVLANGQITLKTNSHNQKKDYSIEAIFDDERIVKFDASQNLLPSDATESESESDPSNLAFLLSGDVKNFPIAIYKPFYYLYPENKLLIFLKDFIQSGVIDSSKIKVRLTKKDVKEKNYNKDNIEGLTKISGLKLVYNPILPPISGMQIDVLQNGIVSDFVIKKGNSSHIAITEGVIHMDWKGHDDTVLLLEAKGRGGVKGLTDFIPEAVHTDLKKIAIDLEKFTGVAKVDVNILIPLKQGSRNTYDIKAVIPSTDLSIFDDKILLTKANIVGQYNGDSLKVKGMGKINGFKSKFDFHQNFVDFSEFDHRLVIDTDVDLSGTKAQKVGFISLLSGNSKVNFEYINTNKIGKIAINAGIKDLEFYLDKLGIHKQVGEEADLSINGNLTSTTKGQFDFKISGSNGLKISGVSNFSDNLVEIIVNNLSHKNTKISAKISSSKDLINVDVKGQILDLSSADMMQFLEKERNSGATVMSLSVDKVKLKQDIWLDGLKLNFKCNKTKCYQGAIKAGINSKTLDIKLVENKEEWEQWVITSNNAGDLLKGVGIYNDMKSGNIKLILKTSRKEIRAGEVIPITNGKFEFERFILNKTPAITKLISFISLPGFISTIIGNNNITFLDMNGEFTFQEEMLNIRSCKANGPFFNFTMQGNVNTLNKVVDLRGHVTPAFYGLSSVVSMIPVIGKIIAGDKHNAGFVSAPYKIKDSY